MTRGQVGDRSCLVSLLDRVRARAGLTGARPTASTLRSRGLALVELSSTQNLPKPSTMSMSLFGLVDLAPRLRKFIAQVLPD
jgi:hypothetical protein